MSINQQTTDKIAELRQRFSPRSIRPTHSTSQASSDTHPAFIDMVFASEKDANEAADATGNVPHWEHGDGWVVTILN